MSMTTRIPLSTAYPVLNSRPVNASLFQTYYPKARQSHFQEADAVECLQSSYVDTERSPNTKHSGARGHCALYLDASMRPTCR